MRFIKRAYNNDEYALDSDLYSSVQKYCSFKNGDSSTNLYYVIRGIRFSGTIPFYYYDKIKEASTDIFSAYVYALREFSVYRPYFFTIVFNIKSTSFTEFDTVNTQLWVPFVVDQKSGNNVRFADYFREKFSRGSIILGI
jgi:hypothetical protein